MLTSLVDSVFDEGCVFAGELLVLILRSELKDVVKFSFGVVVESVHESFFSYFFLEISEYK